MENISVDLKLYAIRNKEKQWFRAKGYGGYGKSWVDDIKMAKIYSKPGPARGQITFWSNSYPEFGVPDLIELVVNNATVINEIDRVATAKKKRELKKANAEKNLSNWQLELASRELREAQERIRKLTEK